MANFLEAFWAILGLWGIGLAVSAVRSLFHGHQDF